MNKGERTKKKKMKEAERKEGRKRKNERKMKDVFLEGENREKNVLFCLKKLAALTVDCLAYTFLRVSSNLNIWFLR